jgi:Na+-driven multidrug efflux pump
MKYNVIFMAFVTLLFFFFAENIIRIFTQDEKVIEFAVLSMQWMSAGYIFYGISMVMIQALNGAGDTKTPTVINIICFWCIQIPLAYLLAKTFDYKATGVFIAVPIAETLIALLAWYYFKKGRWKEIKI